jgi:predicted permease
VIFNLSGGQLAWGTDRFLSLLANTSLPLGLLSVGAALRPTELRGQLGTMIANSLVRLLVVPSIALLCARVTGLPTIETAILVLFFALPTAPTSYVLTRQLGGDGQLMAAIITIQTLLSAVSLLLVVAVVG